MYYIEIIARRYILLLQWNTGRWGRKRHYGRVRLAATHGGIRASRSFLAHHPSIRIISLISFHDIYMYSVNLLQ